MPEPPMQLLLRPSSRQLKAASEIYPILHGDIVDGGSIPYVEDFCKCVCILQLQDYDTPPAFLTLLDQSTGSSNSRMEKRLQTIEQTIMEEVKQKIESQ